MRFADHASLCQDNAQALTVHTPSSERSAIQRQPLIETMTTQRFSRKQFLKFAVLLMSVYPLKLFYDAGKAASTANRAMRRRTLPLDLPEGVSFHGDIIAYRLQGEMTFFSARCPHLGCRINRFENEELVCPCHGSRFTPMGGVKQGPALKDLTALSYSTDVNQRQITVFLPN